MTEIALIHATNDAQIPATMDAIGNAAEAANQIVPKDVKDNRNTYHITIAVVVHATEFVKVAKAVATHTAMVVAMAMNTKRIK